MNSVQEILDECKRALVKEYKFNKEEVELDFVSYPDELNVVNVQVPRKVPDIGEFVSSYIRRAEELLGDKITVIIDSETDLCKSDDFHVTYVTPTECFMVTYIKEDFSAPVYWQDFEELLEHIEEKSDQEIWDTIFDEPYMRKARQSAIKRFGSPSMKRRLRKLLVESRGALLAVSPV